MGGTKYRPAWWYVVVSWVLTFAIGIVIHAIWSDYSIGSLLLVPFAVSVSLYFTMSLEVGEAGITMARRSASWQDLELHRSRWGETLRTSKATPRREQAGVWLPLFESNWREGTIGHQVAIWAPHLFAEPDEA